MSASWIGFIGLWVCALLNAAFVLAGIRAGWRPTTVLLNSLACAACGAALLLLAVVGP